MVEANTRFTRFAQLALASALALVPLVTMAQGRHSGSMGPMEREFRPEMRPEIHREMVRPMAVQPAPRSYQRFERPNELEVRPRTFDRDQYHHDFRAWRTFSVGPYHPREQWQNRHWHSGETLPVVFWTDDYYLTDYWLFGLEVPPVGYEWVRYGSDALLVNLTDGEILQSVYDVFN
ncbi:MAG: RcnB family protein [Azoarcus sp.]|jgi:Ni/Co efflux regulator RcnB|nr:RcnB family protein [Azoarcus sp.]